MSKILMLSYLGQNQCSHVMELTRKWDSRIAENTEFIHVTFFITHFDNILMVLIKISETGLCFRTDVENEAFNM